MDSNKLIVLEQLPVIKQQLELLKQDIEKKVTKALALAVTTDTYKDVKKVRAELNKESQEWESRRKDVKNKIMAPYNEFEGIYKDCVSDQFRTADAALKKKIDEVEDGLKAEKEAEVKEFYSEYVAARAQEGYDLKWLTFDRMDLKVNMSVSMKALKELIRSFVDEVIDNIDMIDTHEHGNEIMVEYKKNLNAAQSVSMVVERKMAITEQEKRAAEAEERRAMAEAAQSEVVAVAEEAPVVEVVVAEPEMENLHEVFEIELNFVWDGVNHSVDIKGTRKSLRALRTALQKGGVEYE